MEYKDQYTIFEFTKDQWIELGKVVRQGDHYVLVGFNREDEEFFSEIGHGTIGVKPSEGDFYIQALAAAFYCSSTISIREG